jgi:hypothetical protein
MPLGASIYESASLAKTSGADARGRSKTWRRSQHNNGTNLDGYFSSSRFMRSTTSAG